MASCDESEKSEERGSLMRNRLALVAYFAYFAYFAHRMTGRMDCV